MGSDRSMQERKYSVKISSSHGIKARFMSTAEPFTIFEEIRWLINILLSKELMCPKNSPITEQTIPMKSTIAIITPCAASQPIKKLL